MIGKDFSPLDLSQDEDEKVFTKSMEKHQEKMSNDKDGWTYGYPDLVDYTPNPYK